MTRQESFTYPDVRGRFRRAEKQGWFLQGANTIRVPLNVSGVALEGGAAASFPGGQPFREAAVLFLMGCRGKSPQLQVLITKRSTDVSSHPGEYCLPGGMRDAAADATLVDTALREAREEVGIGGEAVEIVCSLPLFLSGWLQTTTVTPVVGLLRGDIDELEIRENRQEVEHTMWVPLRHFVVGDYHRELRGPWRGLLSTISSFHLPSLASGTHPGVVWGLTAAICTAASSIALGELPHYPSFCQAISEINDRHVHTTELAHTSQLFGTLLHSSKL